MCEFFAVIGGNPSTMLEIAKDHVESMTGRQRDGLGLLAIANDGSYAVRHSLSDKFLLDAKPVRHLPFANFLRGRLEFKPDTWALIWHARAATTKGKGIDDVHPFEGGRYVLAHNGVVQFPNRWGHTPKGDDDHDSRALLRALERKGFGAWKTFAGYGVIFVYDKTQKALHIIKDGGRLSCIQQEGCTVLATAPGYKLTGFEEVLPNFHATIPLNGTGFDAVVEPWSGFMAKEATHWAPKTTTVYAATGKQEKKGKAVSTLFEDDKRKLEVVTLPSGKSIMVESTSPKVNGSAPSTLSIESSTSQCDLPLNRFGGGEPMPYVVTADGDVMPNDIHDWKSYGYY